MCGKAFGRQQEQSRQRPVVGVCREQLHKVWSWRKVLACGERAGGRRGGRPLGKGLSALSSLLKADLSLLPCTLPCLLHPIQPPPFQSVELSAVYGALALTATML